MEMPKAFPLVAMSGAHTQHLQMEMKVFHSLRLCTATHIAAELSPRVLPLMRVSTAIHRRPPAPGYRKQSHARPCPSTMRTLPRVHNAHLSASSCQSQCCLEGNPRLALGHGADGDTLRNDVQDARGARTMTGSAFFCRVRTVIRCERRR